MNLFKDRCLLLFRLPTEVISNVEMGCCSIKKNVLGTSGVASCWCLVVFLSENFIYIRHISPLSLPNRCSMYLVQRNLEKMADMFFKYISNEGKKHLEIERVCLFGGIDAAGNYLTDLGRATISFCQSVPRRLLVNVKYCEADTAKFLSFLNKIVYTSLNMNVSVPIIKNNEPDTYTSGVTVFGESFGSIRRVTLIVSDVSMTTHIVVLDPLQNRLNLAFKSSKPPKTYFNVLMLAKNIEISTVHLSQHPPFPSFPTMNFYRNTTLHHVLGNLQCQLAEPLKDSKLVPNAEEGITDDENETN